MKSKSILSIKHISSLSVVKYVCGNKNDPATQGKMEHPCFVFPGQKSSREVIQSHGRILHHLLTQRRNTFAIQRQIKRGIDHAMWIIKLGYLPRPGNIQLPLNTSECRKFFASVQTEWLCQNFHLGQILQNSPGKI